MILISLMRLSPLVGRILQGKAVIMGFIPAYQQIQILSHEADSLLEPLGDLQFKKLNSEIEFRDVFFSYPDQTLAINAVSMRIKAGKMTALVGKSGSGKTTITDLILGFYLHNSGEILLDGIGVASYDKNSFRNKVGYVPQEAQLFNLSIRENLLWSFPNASENDIWKACRIANAEEFISKLPEQLDTQLGDHGVRLSGGQKQRLALARAVIRKPELLILDEATSALDSESERLIKESLDKLVGKMTILIIAHRLSTIRKSNYVYVLDNGRVVEEGSYDKLSVLSHGQLYNMIREQAF